MSNLSNTLTPISSLPPPSLYDLVNLNHLNQSDFLPLSPPLYLPFHNRSRSPLSSFLISPFFSPYPLPLSIFLRLSSPASLSLPHFFPLPPPFSNRCPSLSFPLNPRYPCTFLPRSLPSKQKPHTIQIYKY